MRERGSDTRRRAPGRDLSPGPPHRGQSLCTCDGHTKRRSKFMDIFCCCSSSASSLHTAASCFLNAPVLHPTHNILSMPAQSFNTDIDLILLRGRTIMCRHSVFAPFFFFYRSGRRNNSETFLTCRCCIKGAIGYFSSYKSFFF